MHPHQVTQWKQQLLQQAPAAFEQPVEARQSAGVEEELYAQIGRLKMQLEGKKKLGPYLPGAATKHDW